MRDGRLKKALVLIAVCGVALCVSVPAMAELSLHSAYYSATDLVDGRAVYDGPYFQKLHLWVGDIRMVTEQDLEAKGTMTILGGFYSYYEGTKKKTVIGTDQAFDLVSGDMVIGESDVFYVPVASNSYMVPFLEHACDGLMGKTVTWSLSSGEKGSDKVPGLRTTEEQMRTYVPYVELKRAGSKVTAVTWRIADPKAISKALTLTFSSQVRVRLWLKKGDRILDEKVSVKAGDLLEGTFSLPEPLNESELGTIGVRLNEYPKDGAVRSYRWHFYARTDSDEGVADWGDLGKTVTVKEGETKTVSLTLKPGYSAVVTDDQNVSDPVDVPTVIVNDRTTLSVDKKESGRTVSLALKGLKPGKTTVKLRYRDDGGSRFVTKKAVEVLVTKKDAPGGSGSSGGCNGGFGGMAVWTLILAGGLVLRGRS